jgi:pilus assembly protein Flp/PilA
MHSLLEQDWLMRKMSMTQHTRRFLADETAATAIEYALIASGIAGAIVAVVGTVGGSVKAMWTAVFNAFH